MPIQVNQPLRIVATRVKLLLWPMIVTLKVTLPSSPLLLYTDSNKC